MGEFTASIAHEINQPLAALMSRKVDPGETTDGTALRQRAQESHRSGVRTVIIPGAGGSTLDWIRCRYSPILDLNNKK
jgi:signal transduction histidine kinase